MTTDPATTTNEFADFVLAQANLEAFHPMALHNPDDDSLELLISNESYRTQKIDFATVYFGRESGDVTGILIRHIKKFIADIEDAEIHLQVVHNGKLKVSHFFKAIREQTKESQKPTLGVLIKQLEKVAAEYNLEANLDCAMSP